MQALISERAFYCFSEPEEAELFWEKNNESRYNYSVFSHFQIGFHVGIDTYIDVDPYGSIRNEIRRHFWSSQDEV